MAFEPLDLTGIEEAPAPSPSFAPLDLSGVQPEQPPVEEFQPLDMSVVEETPTSVSRFRASIGLDRADPTKLSPLSRPPDRETTQVAEVTAPPVREEDATLRQAEAQVEPLQLDQPGTGTIAQGAAPITRGVSRVGASFIRAGRGFLQSLAQGRAGKAVLGASRLIGLREETGEAIDKLKDTLSKETRIEAELNEDFQERLGSKLQDGDIGGAAFQVATEGGIDVATGLLQVMMLGSAIKGGGGGAGALVRPGLAESSKAILSNAVMRGAYSYLTTPGTPSEKGQAAAWTTAFMSTPAVARNVRFARLADMGLNTMLSTLSGAYPDAWENAQTQAEASGDPDSVIPLFVANAFPNFAADMFASSGTKFKGNINKSTQQAIQKLPPETRVDAERLIQSADASIEQARARTEAGDAARAVEPTLRTGGLIDDPRFGLAPKSDRVKLELLPAAEGSRLALADGLVNAVVRKSGSIIVQNREHGDIISRIEDTSDPAADATTARAWSVGGRKDPSSIITMKDVQDADGDFYKAVIKKKIEHNQPVSAEARALVEPEVAVKPSPAAERVEPEVEVVRPLELAERAEPEAQPLREILDVPAGASVKRAIEIATGVKPVEREVTITEPKLLRLVKRAEARGAKQAAKVARVERAAEIRAQIKAKDAKTKQMMKENAAAITEYAREQLPKSDANRVRLIAQKAKTPLQLIRAFDAIDRIAEKQLNKIAINEFTKELRKAKNEKLTPSSRRILDEILGGFEKSEIGEKKLLRLQSMQKFINDNPDHNVPDKLIAEIDRLNRIPIAKMDTDDIRSLSNALRSIRTQSNLKRNIMARRQNRTVKQHAEEFVKEVPKNVKPTREIRPGIQEPKGGRLNRFKLASMGLESIAEEVDGGKTGLASDILFRNTIKQGQIERQAANDAVSEFIIGRMNEAGIDRADVESWSQPILDRNSTKHKILSVGGKNFARRVGPKAKSLTVDLESGEKLELTYGEAAKLWRYSKNARAMRNLIDQEKGGIRLAAAEDKNFKLTANDLEKIFEQMPDNVKKVADFTHEYENTIQKNNINRTSQRRSGVELAREDDYVKAVRSVFDRDKGVQIEGGLQTGTIDQKLDDRGFLKQKTNIRAPLVVRDEFSEFYNNARDVNHYVGMAEPLAIAKSFIAKPEVRDSITKNYGKNTVDAIEKALRDIENPPKPSESLVARGVEGARRNIVKSVLGAGGVLGGVVAKQPVSYLTASTEIAPRYLSAATSMPLADKAEIARANPILGARLATGKFERDVGPADSASNFWTGKTGLTDKLMGPTSAADALAIRLIYNAAKLETQEQNPGASLKQIGERAEEIVRKTQPTFTLEDRSEIGRSQDVLTKLATSFTSQLNKNAQMLIRGVNRYRGSEKTMSDKADLAKTITSVAIVAPLAIAAIDELRDQIMVASGMRKRKKDQKSVAARLAVKTLQNNLSSIYIGGPVINKAIDRSMGKGFLGGEGINNIVSSTLSQLSQGAGGLVEDAVTGDWDERSIKDARKLIIAINNLTTGLPLGPLDKTVRTGLTGAGIIEGEEVSSRQKSTRRRRRRKR